MESTWRIFVARWDEPQDREELAFVRRSVFVDEQRVPEELEWDGLDSDAFHLLARDAARRPVGAARMLADGHIGRMAVLKGYREGGVGTALLRRMLEEAGRRKYKRVYLDAQIHAIGFYERLGFVVRGEPFMDAGIPHRRMVRTLDEPAPETG